MAYGFNNDKSKAAVYTQAEVDSLLTGKANTEHSHSDLYYSKSAVDTKLGDKANIASPTFTGTPKAPTPAATDSSTKIATTAYVNNHLNSNKYNYKAGDIFTFGGSTPCIGYITTTKTTMRFTLHTPKSMKNISSINVNLMCGAIIGDQGYVGYQDVSTSAQTNWTDLIANITATKVNDNTIRVTLVASEGFNNVTNNRPIIYAPAYGNIELEFL